MTELQHRKTNWFAHKYKIIRFHIQAARVQRKRDREINRLVKAGRKNDS